MKAYYLVSTKVQYDGKETIEKSVMEINSGENSNEIAVNRLRDSLVGEDEDSDWSEEYGVFENVDSTLQSINHVELISYTDFVVLKKYL